MDNRFTICLRELKSLKKEKTILLALLIQLFIASFSSFLVVGLVSLYSPDSAGTNIQVNIGISGDKSEELSAISESIGGVSVIEYANFSRAFDDFRSGQLNAILDTDRSESGRVRVSAIVPESNFRTTFIVVQIKKVLKEYERYKRNQFAGSLKYSLLDLPREVASSPYFQFSYSVLIPILVFLPIVIGGSVASDFVTEEFEQGTMELLRVSPVSEMEIYDGKMIAMVLLSVIQVGIWFVLLTFNNLVIYNILLLMLFVLGLSVLSVVFGSIVGLVFKDRRQTQFIYSFGVIIFLVLSSLLPESLGNTVSKLAIGSETTVTYLSVLLYLILAFISYIGFYFYVKNYNISSKS